MLVIDIVCDDPDNKFAPYQHMANAIIEVTHKHGDCVAQDLWALGFTRDETRNCWHMAHAMATVELTLMERRIALPKRWLGRK